ncbi:hypothetical protein [Streptomyces sp. NPDC005423]|uniref:hypothetical protein n=1 Tax=Streptomyces sp. NPDC005423 TaxID=3155343 RepID=UPI0033B6D748
MLTDATGSTGGLTIPTQYRGNRLATMEATYADGSNAGPVNWSPYQEVNVSFTFSPDYSGNGLLLTSDFLNALRNNAQASLVFHFWSGATVTYRVIKNAGAVTGTVV